MSGTEPISFDDELPEDGGDLYGTPKEPRSPGDETSGPVEPLDFVEPLNLGSESGEPEDDGPQAIRLDEPFEEADADAEPIRLSLDGDAAEDAEEDGPSDFLSLGSEEPEGLGLEPTGADLDAFAGATPAAEEPELRLAGEAPLELAGEASPGPLDLAGSTDPADQGDALEFSGEADSLELSEHGEPLQPAGEAPAESIYGDGAPAGPAAGDGAGSADQGNPDLGNRPADGARVVSVSEVFSEDFIGAEGASDFLGLDTDFDPTPVASTPGEGLELDLRGAPEAVVATEPPVEDPAGSAISPPEEGELLAAELGAGDDGVEGLDGESGFDPLDEEAPAPRGRRGLLVAGAFAVGLGAVAFLTLGDGRTVPFFGGAEPVEVAQGPSAPKAPTEPQTTQAPEAGQAPAGGEAQPGDVATPEAQAESAPAEPRPIEDFLPADAVPEPESQPDPEVLPESTVDVATEGELAAETEPVEQTTEGEVAEAPTPPPALTIDDMVVLAEDPNSFYAQNASLLDLVWHGDSVPGEAIAANVRILTPAVGDVRVHMANAEVFEGRLFAVGQDKVWVDMELGRLGLDGSFVDRIERASEVTVVEGIDPGTLSVGDRVRARVPGGVIYGQIRSRIGNAVTMVTESGARITLEDPVLEPVSERKSVVLKL